MSEFGTYAAIYRSFKQGEFGHEYGAQKPLAGFKITRIEPSPTARMAGAPVETGFQTNDTKIIDPMTISVTGLVKSSGYKHIYKELKEMFNNRRFEFYSVISKVDYYTNLCLLEIPHKEDAERYDVIEMTLKFQKVMMDKEQKTAADASNSDTASVGLVAGA